MHACENCFRKPLSNKQQKTIEQDKKKKQAFQAEGYSYNVIKECEWNQKLPSVSSTPTTMARILLRDNEQSLLDAIRQDEIFGFAVCSVQTPQELIDEFEKVSA